MLIKGIYSCFSHWYHGGSIWFYSDPHFADKDMLTVRKNYIGDEKQVKSINSKIGKNDTLVILGDVGDPEFLKQLRGYKILILGNHDKGASVYIPYVDEVYEGMLTISNKIILSHEPVDVPFMYNIHGHDHVNHNKDNLHLNVCAEIINYTPISLSQLIKAGTFKHVADIHRAAINKANKNK
jgi:calcineurin-like phosphoesterase family protein